MCGKAKALNARKLWQGIASLRIGGQTVRSIFFGSALMVASCFGADAQVVGGPGGGPFDDACRPDDVMVGYNVLSGKAMNQFAAVCQAQNNGVLVGKNYGLRTWGKNFENDYKFFDTPRCPAGAAISALNVFVNKFNELDSVSATCSPLRRNTGRTSFFPKTSASGGQAVRNGPSTCPQGTIAVGVTGRSGALVDSVGLRCAPFPWH